MPKVETKNLYTFNKVIGDRFIDNSVNSNNTHNNIIGDEMFRNQLANSVNKLRFKRNTIALSDIYASNQTNKMEDRPRVRKVKKLIGRRPLLRNNTISMTVKRRRVVVTKRRPISSTPTITPTSTLVRKRSRIPKIIKRNRITPTIEPTPVIVLKTITTEYSTTLVTMKRQRTYTYVVDRVHNSEHLVQSSTLVRDQILTLTETLTSTKEILLTVPVVSPTSTLTSTIPTSTVNYY